LNFLLTGAAGQLGNELYPLLSSMGEVTAADVNPGSSNAPGCLQVDLGNAGQLENLLNRYTPDVIVNAAAYTAVDRAEEQSDLAFLINAEMPGRMARWAARNDSALVHYSTDYVFDGSASRPYLETDVPSPLNVYGESKLAGEVAIENSGCQALILRTSWVYSSHGSNFVLSMLKLARTQPHLSIVDDQVGCPTWARNLAQVTQRCIERGLPGAGQACRLFHFSDRDAVSWYDFASLVFRTGLQLGLLDSVPEHVRIDTDGYPQAATRPKFSVLDTRAIQSAIGFEVRGLEESITACMQEISIHE
jgi:dTDP-4-dehydrorhamnose reductase